MEAQQERQAAEQAKAEALQAQQQAEAARQAALEQQQALAAQTQTAQAQAQTAEQRAQAAEQEKEAMRQRLLTQLNQVLETRDSARGLIVNMSDVLFDVNQATLKPGAKVRLAKVAGIIQAYPDLKLQIEGYTDSTGSVEHNQELSERRAAAVRDFLVAQGVSMNNVYAQGFGPENPVASNGTPQGRQMNRRVDLVVNGESIAAQKRATGAEWCSGIDGRAEQFRSAAAGAAGERHRNSVRQRPSHWRSPHLLTRRWAGTLFQVSARSAVPCSRGCLHLKVPGQNLRLGR